MAETKDYLTVYKRFFDNFAKTVDPDDQLPVRVAGYRLCDNEIVGEAVDWTLQYLSQRNCPPGLLAPITRIVIDEIKQACQTQPLALGFRSQENCYLPLKLMQAVTNKVNEVCLRFCDNGRVTSLPPPSPGPLLSSCAIKNSRRCMEDRHVILEDFHAFFNIKDSSPASYYAVFDGHAGTDAAIYSVSHLHQFLAESSYYPTDPDKAIKDAFFRTDSLFVEKSNKENLHSGTTAVCALLRPKEKKLYVAWLGDSQAVLVRNGYTLKLVNPHKPDREDEKTRIKDMGGSVLYWGTWRVNGQLAVSRAIGDVTYKPYVTAEPDVRTIDLHGDEDFLILACDGLWDFVAAEDVVRAVYEQLKMNSADLEAVSQRLVQLSKQQGSTDNITVIVAFLTEPSQLAARARDDTPRPWAPANGPQPSAPVMEAFDVNTNSGAAPGPVPAGEPTNPFEADLASPTVCAQKVAGAGLLLDIGGAATDNSFEVTPFNNGHTNGNLYAFLDRSPNGKVTDEDDDDDSGAENAVDDADEKHASLLSKNPFGADIELQRQQLSEFDPVNEPRHDTPTPPADDVPGVIGLVSDNVAESGEESEDEWNYYRVEPSEKSSQPSGEKEQQTKEEVCPEQPQKVEETEDDDNMESQLNPNAAEFIPSPTHGMSSLEDFILSPSKNPVSIDDVVVPSSSEFEKEVSSRPSDSNFDNSFFNSTISSVDTAELIAAQDKEFDKSQEFSVSQQEAFVNSLTVKSEENVGNEPSVTLDESAAFSTKAEYGDESTTSFMTSGSDFQKVLGLTNIMETSLIEQDFLSEGNAADGEKPDINTQAPVLECQESTFQQDDLIHDFQKEPVHISFELQKELAPQMESQPERVKVDSVDHSPILESEHESEPSNDFAEDRKLFGHQELSHKNDVLPFQVSGLDDIAEASKTVLQDLGDSDKISESTTAAKVDDFANITSSRIDEMDFLNEKFTNPGDKDLFEFPSNVEKPILEDAAESRAPIMESNFVQETESRVAGIDLQHSEYLANEFKENFTVQQVSQNLLSNEISTPEYEKLEKDVEASEVYQEHFNALTEDIAVNFTSDSDNKGDVETGGVLLESAHPDQEALLDDACVESTPFKAAPSTTAFAADFIAPLDISSPESGLPLTVATSDTVPSNIALLDTRPTETELFFGVPVDSTSAKASISEGVPLGGTSEVALQDSFTEELIGASIPEEPAPLHIPSIESVQSEAFQCEILESAQAPPPTPLITQLGGEEPLDFSRGVDDITEVVEKLSATQQLSEVSGVDNSQAAEIEVPGDVLTTEVQPEPAVDESTIPTTNAQMSEPVVADVVESEKPVAEETSNDLKTDDGSSQSDVAAAAAVAACGLAAAVATTAAVVTSSDKGPKKEKEVSPKKPAAIAKDKRPSTEKPKTTTRTTPVPSRLTATTAKPKSPTSPLKSPVASKTTVRQITSTVPSKPLVKTQVTKTTMRPLASQSSRTTTSASTTAAAKTKPAGSQPPAKPAASSLGLPRPKSAAIPTERKPLTNGDIKSAPKRPDTLTKTSTAKQSPRPASAPATKAVSKTSSTVSTTITRTKPPLNGPTKPRSLTSVTQVKTVAKTSNEKEIKDTANKQISTRTTTTVRSTTATAATKTLTSATRKIESKVVANGKGPALKPSSMVKSSTTSSSKVPPKKPATTTRLKTSKTGSVVEKSETVQGSKTVVATNEVKSEVLIETTQTAA